MRTPDYTDRGAAARHFASQRPGQTLLMEGAGRTHARFGKQFHGDRYRTAAPSTGPGIRKYLGLRLVHGIGPKMADRVVYRFGEKTIEESENTSKHRSWFQRIKCPQKAENAGRGHSQPASYARLLQFVEGLGPEAGVPNAGPLKATPSIASEQFASAKRTGTCRAARLQKQATAKPSTLPTESPRRNDMSTPQKLTCERALNEQK